MHLQRPPAGPLPCGGVARRGRGPCPPAEGLGSPTAHLNGSAGWGDAVVVVPGELYRAYGDERLLAELWPSMVAWLARAERMSRTRRHPVRAAIRPEPAPHEQFLWDSGFHWGEWLEPGGGPGNFEEFVAVDKSDVATAYLARCADLAARVAAVLGPGRRSAPKRGAPRPCQWGLAERVRRRRRPAHPGHPG